MRLIKIFLLLFLLVSCSSKQITIEEYLAYTVKFAKKEVKEPSGSYSLFVPKDWETKFEIEEYNNAEHIIFQAISDIDEKGGFSGITIIETKSLAEQKDLNSQFDYSLNKYNDSFFSVLDSGETYLFSDTEAYFIQAETVKAELFDFFVGSKKENTFYLINISTEKDEHQKQNMSMMLSCLKTFKITQN